MKNLKIINMTPCLIFEHVPKAAGTTFERILSKHYTPESIFRITGSSPGTSIEQFKALPSQERKRFNLITGHGAFELYDHVPRECVCITFLRDPVDRIISHYYYARRTPGHYLFQTINKKGMSLYDYAASGISEELENNYTFRFSRMAKDELNKYPDLALSQAKRNLDDFFLIVGLTEQFDETLLLVKRKLGWRKFPLYTKTNVTPYRPTKESLPLNTLDAIRKRNELDIELYSYAQKRFSEAVKAEGPSFSNELKFSMRRNKYYQKYNTVILQIQTILNSGKSWFKNG